MPKDPGNCWPLTLLQIGFWQHWRRCVLDYFWQRLPKLLATFLHTMLSLRSQMYSMPPLVFQILVLMRDFVCWYCLQKSWQHFRLIAEKSPKRPPEKSGFGFEATSGYHWFLFTRILRSGGLRGRLWCLRLLCVVHLEPLFSARLSSLSSNRESPGLQKSKCQGSPKAMATMIWGFFRDHPPNLIIGGIEFIIGGLVCISLFNYFVKTFTHLKIGNDQVLSYCDSVGLSCKLVSALFATLTCIIGVSSKSCWKLSNLIHDGLFSVLRDCGCISFKVTHNTVKHYMVNLKQLQFHEFYQMSVFFSI